jgi:hypothetical protein
MKKEEKQDEKKEVEKRKHVSMTDEEIKKLAEDMYKGFVFTDRHLNNADELPMVFMPLALAGKELIEELQKIPPGMIYEYADKAGPMGVNGMPVFTSFRVASVEDTRKVFEHYNKIKEAVANV